MSNNMTPRQLRRMEARRTRKSAAKQNPSTETLLNGAPDTAPVSRGFLEERRLRKNHLETANQAASNQAETNKANAQHSTGPKTLEGKAISSRNAVRHGLTGTFCVLPGEDQDAYLVLHTELLCEHDPQTATEELLVSDMARHYWLTQRAMRLQEELMTRDFNQDLVMKQLALFLRYQTTNQRAFHKCLADLQKLQKQRKKEEDGFVSQMEELEQISNLKKTNDQRLKSNDSSKTAAAGYVSPATGFVSQFMSGSSVSQAIPSEHAAKL